MDGVADASGGEDEDFFIGEFYNGAVKESDHRRAL
jgi:hypothetical protein